jgi:hypothetical protein
MIPLKAPLKGLQRIPDGMEIKIKKVMLLSAPSKFCMC